MGALEMQKTSCASTIVAYIIAMIVESFSTRNSQCDIRLQKPCDFEMAYNCILGAPCRFSARSVMVLTFKSFLLPLRLLLGVQIDYFFRNRKHAFKCCCDCH